MDVFKEGKYFRYVERAPLWLGISLVVIVVGIVMMLSNKATTGSFFNLSIHYTGGEQIMLRFDEELEIDGQAAKGIVTKYAEGEAIVQVNVEDPHLVSIKMRVAEGTGSLKDMKEELGNMYGGFSDDEANANPITEEEAFVGPTVGAELIKNTILALIFGCVLIMLYILLRFQRWQMSLAAIGALIHDVLITLGFTAALGLEVSDSFIAVILTIIGYSINDTIIIFDRVRENLRTHGDGVPLAQICNLSLNQTLVRSINTVATVIIMIVVLMVLGGNNLQDFLTAMLIGMISGGYSSIFVATPLMLFFSRGKMVPAAAGAGPVAVVPDDSVPEAGVETTVSQAISSAVQDKQDKKKVKKQRRR